MALRLLGASLLAAAVLPLTQAGAAPVADAPGPDSVQITVMDVSPNTPLATNVPTALTFTLQLTNTSTENLAGVTIEADRSDPIGSASALAKAMAAPQPPSSALRGDVLPPGAAPKPFSLGPGQPFITRVTTTSSTLLDAGLCICAPDPAIYPIYFTALWDSGGGALQPVGHAQTYVPAFQHAPKPVQVAWAWPLLDRPHRLASDNVFLDDDLAASVSTGGRLYRMLLVAEQVVTQHVPFTLVLDPELVDELAVMVTGYQVGSTKPVAGTGGAAASAWLDRLRTVVAAPDTQVVLTPYADPDVQALATRGVPWTTTMPAAMRTRVTAALGGYVPSTDVAWPDNSMLGPDAAQELSDSGIHTVLLGPDAVAGSAAVPAGSGRTVRVRTTEDDLTVLQMPETIADDVRNVLSVGGTSLAALPNLIAKLAVTAVDDPSGTHTVLLLPDRYLDPSGAAARAILGTTLTGWSRGTTASSLAALASDAPHARLVPPPGGGRLLADALDAIDKLTSTLPAVTSMLVDTPTGTTRFGGITEAVQRMKSSGWSQDRQAAREAAAQLGTAVDAIADGVKLIVPSNGSYTMGSNDAPLPVTIENDLDEDIQVRLSIDTVGGVPGFHADDPGLITVGARSKYPIHVPVHIDRAGRIRVQVDLIAPKHQSDGQPLVLGKPLQLSVRSTALGQIGKIITWGAGIVLALALLVRLTRRLLRGKPRTGPATPAAEVSA